MTTSSSPVTAPFHVCSLDSCFGFSISFETNMSGSPASVRK